MQDPFADDLGHGAVITDKRGRLRLAAMRKNPRVDEPAHDGTTVADFAPDREAYDQMLSRLHVVTMPQHDDKLPAEVCDGSYTCECSTCSDERAALVQAAAERRGAHDRWDLVRRRRERRERRENRHLKAAA